MWFAALDGAYWVFCAASAGKVKRLRHSSRARVALCNARGRVTGPWLDAVVTLEPDPQASAAAYGALRKKYGFQMWIADLFGRLTGRINKRRILRVELASGE